jgi:hypothetical protein
MKTTPCSGSIAQAWPPRLLSECIADPISYGDHDPSFFTLTTILVTQ